MSDEQKQETHAERQARLDAAAHSRRNRIDAIVRKVAPQAIAFYDKSGDDKTAQSWPPRTLDGGKVIVQAPYMITPLVDGRQKVTVTSDDGDVLSGVGATIDDALTALEAKLR